MPRKCSVYSSSDEETYDSSRQHYSGSHSHRKTCSPSSSRHITSRHSPSHSDTKWERHRSPLLSWTRRNRHGSRSHSRSYPRKRLRHSRSHSTDFHTNKEHYRSRSHPSLSHSKEWKRRRQRSRSNDSKDIYTHKVKEHYRSRSRSTDSKDIHTHKVKEHYRSRSCSTDSMDIHTNKEDYRSRTASRSKARGSHSHMYSRFYSSDIVQRKHHPRSLSHLPVCSRKNWYKLSDTSPQKPCETSHS